MEMSEKDDLVEMKHWFVMRDLKRANAKTPAYKMLAEENYEVYTPLKWVVRVNNGRQVRKQVPFIQDLLFVHGIQDEIDLVVDKTPTLQYRFQKGGAYRQPMIVKDRDMEYFLHAVDSTENPHYYLPEELTSEMCGRIIRIVGGTLDGYEGKLLKVRGAKKKQILIELPGFFSVGIEVDADYIQLV